MTFYGCGSGPITLIYELVLSNTCTKFHDDISIFDKLQFGHREGRTDREISDMKQYKHIYLKWA